jgi:hypothetical protein
MQIVIRPAAAADIEDAFVWYERQRPGLVRRGLVRYSSRSSSLSSCTSRHEKDSPSALSIWRLLPDLPGLNRRGGVYACETQSQALAVPRLTANMALVRTRREPLSLIGPCAAARRTTPR